MRSGVAERTFGCIASVADICFGSSKVKPAIRTNHAHIDNLMSAAFSASLQARIAYAAG
jgi:hypothetical protein